jgi:hypothetical protein
MSRARAIQKDRLDGATTQRSADIAEEVKSIAARKSESK